MMKQNRYFNYLRYIISFLILGFLIYLIRNDLKDVYRVIIRSNLSLFSLAFILHIGVVMMLLSLRMKILFEVVDIRISFIESVKLNFIGYFFNNFLPTSIGGDFVKSFLSSKISKKNIESITAVLADRLFGVYALFLLAAIAVLFQSASLPNKLLVYIIWFIFSCLTLVIFLWDIILELGTKVIEKIKIPKLIEFINRLKDLFKYYSRHKSQSIIALIISILTKLLTVIIVYLLSYSIGFQVDVGILFWLIPVIMAISLLPSLNGLGIREGAFIYFLGPYYGHENAFALSIMYLAVNIFSDFIGGVIFVFSKEYSKHIFLRKGDGDKESSDN